MTADMLSNKRINPIVTELLTRHRKLNISLVFITQPILLCQKILDLVLGNILLWNSKQTRTSTITFNHSSDIDFRDFMNLYKKCTAKLNSFLVIDPNVASDNTFSERIF